MYEEIRKSPGLAFLFEFLLPGAGSIYADHTIGAIITWGLAVGGMLVIINSGRTTRDPYTGDDRTEFNGTQLATGVLMLLGGRTYGLIDSVVSARAYNERLRQRLGLGAALSLNVLPVATGGHVLVPSLRIRALLLCAKTGLGSAKIVPQAIRLISRDARGASPPVVRAAIEVVVSRREAQALAAVDADDALCRLARPIGFFGRLLGRQTPPADVLVTAISALGRLGSASAKKVLKQLRGSDDPDVVHAAEDALAGRTSKTTAGSSVFASEVRLAKKR